MGSYSCVGPKATRVLWIVRLRRLLLIGILLAWPPCAAAQDTTTVTGVVIDGATGVPIPDVRVDSGQVAVTTARDGRFSVVLRQGDTTLRFRADGYLETLVEVADPDIEVRLFRNTFAETVEVVSETVAQPRPSSTPIPPEEVFQVAGSVDNVFRTLDLLPGVAATDDFGSRLAVRGGTPDQNLTVMDGVDIHNPYRLFGITSAFNPETVDSFQLTAGGFGVAYGDRLSSLLIVETRPGSRDFQGATALSVTDGNIVLEGRRPSGTTARGSSAHGAPTTTWSPARFSIRTSRRSPTCSCRRVGHSVQAIGSR